MDRKFGIPVDDARYSHAANLPVTTKRIKAADLPQRHEAAAHRQQRHHLSQLCRQFRQHDL